MPGSKQAQTMPDPASRREQLKLIEENAKLRIALRNAGSVQDELREVLEMLSGPPWHPAILREVIETQRGPRALVCVANAMSVVDFADDIDPKSLSRGALVFLNGGRSALMALAPEGFPRCGETAVFESQTPDGRLRVRARDEQIVVDAAADLDTDALAPGDPVRWDRSAQLVFERLESTEGRSYLLEEADDLAIDAVAGQDAGRDTLIAALSAALVEPEKATRSGVDASRAVLLYRPPGCGKTLVARLAAAEIQRRSGQRCHFASVRPGEFESPYVGETEQNIRARFKALREAASDGLGVLFLHEIDAVGRTRGGLSAHHSDRFLAALLTEIDGFTGRGRVALVAATNRRDLLDPALLSRLSDVEIEIRRPDLSGASAIFAVHLPSELPYRPNGADAAATRQEIIERAVSALYAPNAASGISELQFRDGTRRTVFARELVSGRLIAQIARAACQAAFRRDIEGGSPGLAPRDMDDAVSDAIERLSTTVTVGNARAYLDDLPQDLDVVRVDPIRRKPRRAYRYVDAG